MVKKFKKKRNMNENWQIELGGTFAIIALIYFILVFINLNDNFWKVFFSMGFVFSVISYVLLFIGFIKEKAKHIKKL